MIATLIITNVLTLLLAALIYWRQDVSHKRTCAVYESCLDKADAGRRDALDRLYASKGQPPTGTNMQAAHLERERQRSERQQNMKGAPSAPMTRMREALAEGEQAQMGASQ